MSRARNPQRIAISFEFSLICISCTLLQERCVLHYPKCYQFNSIKFTNSDFFLQHIAKLLHDRLATIFHLGWKKSILSSCVYNSGISFKCNTLVLLMILKGDAGMGFSRTAVYCDLCCLHLVNFVRESVWG